jgi:hypothetical protein
LRPLDNLSGKNQRGARLRLRPFESQECRISTIFLGDFSKGRKISEGRKPQLMRIPTSFVKTGSRKDAKGRKTDGEGRKTGAEKCMKKMSNQS